MKTSGSVALAAALVLAAIPAAGAAQVGAVAGDPGSWLAWYGCWEAIEEGEAVGSSEVVCVLPGQDDRSARFATIENGRIAQETLIRADGVERPIDEGGCAGVESAQFSSDGRRVFTRARMMCSQAERMSSGVLAFVSDAEWVDAQALTVRDQHAARAVRYVAVIGVGLPAEVVAALPTDRRLAQETARLHASGPLDLPAVIEASREAAAPAVDAVLAGGGAGFSVNAGLLKELRKNQVPTSTIDVLVALSHPDRFVVRAGVPREVDVPVTTAAAPIGAAALDRCFDPYRARQLYGMNCYDPFGYRYDRRYGSLGYSPYGYDPYGWSYGRPVVVIVDPRDRRAEGGGAVVKGTGYTQGAGASSRTAVPRAAPATTSARPSSTPSTSAAPSGSGSSGGSSSAAPARTAKPRE